MTRARTLDEKYRTYNAALSELVQFLENGNINGFMAQPTQGDAKRPRRCDDQIRRIE